MKIISWNVNGLRSVISKGLLDFINSQDPDILCLQEIKIDKSTLFPSTIDLFSSNQNKNNELIDLPNYEEFWHPAQKKGYSGTAIFTKKTPLNTIDFESIPLAYEEGRLLGLEFENFFIINVYVPNSKGDLSRIPLRRDTWDPLLRKKLKELQKIKPVIICGDFNVAHQENDLANPKTKVGQHGFTNEERAGMTNYLSQDLVDVFRCKNPSVTDKYTWWSNFNSSRSRNMGWRIDYFLISKIIYPLVTNIAHLESQMGSDHCPIALELNLK